MNFSFVIRKAVIGDAADIYKIIKEAFVKYSSVLGLEHKTDALCESLEEVEYSINNHYVFIALIDDVPVGSVRINVEDADSAYLSRFAVSSGYRNIGIGKAMMNLVDKFIINKNIKVLYLHTASKHHELVKFYYSRGFHIDSTSKTKGYTRALMLKEYGDGSFASNLY